jgi:DNA polymerase sigma
MLPIAIKASESLFAEDIISVVGPAFDSCVLRERIYETICTCIRTILSLYPSLSSSIHMYGSVPLSTFLADSDIDISVIIKEEGKFIDSTLSKQIYIKIVEELRRMAITNPEITNLHKIAAEVQVIKFQCYSVPIDITLQQYSPCIANSLLERVNQLIGKGGIFKRAIILTKAWCLYDSHVLGSQHGNLCSYSIEIMIMYILNNYYEECITALDVFRLFVKVFSKFNWIDDILTVFGPISITQYKQLVFFNLLILSMMRMWLLWL